MALASMASPRPGLHRASSRPRPRRWTGRTRPHTGTRQSSARPPSGFRQARTCASGPLEAAPPPPPSPRPSAEREALAAESPPSASLSLRAGCSLSEGTGSAGRLQADSAVAWAGLRRAGTGCRGGVPVGPTRTPRIRAALGAARRGPATRAPPRRGDRHLARPCSLALLTVSSDSDSATGSQTGALGPGRRQNRRCPKQRRLATASGQERRESTLCVCAYVHVHVCIFACELICVRVSGVGCSRNAHGFTMRRNVETDCFMLTYCRVWKTHHLP